MNDESAQLPWDELQQTEAGIPWDAIRKIADAAPTDDDVIHRLFDTYEQARKTLDTQASAADLYVAAIFALAAPRFDTEQKREVSGYLIERLVEACEEDDITPDALVAAVGAMGPVVLPLVLDVLSSERDIKDDWFWLWELTALAAETEDDDLRRRTVRVCVDLLERAERGGSPFPRWGSPCPLRCATRPSISFGNWCTTL